MANNHPSAEATTNDDFLDQILGIPTFGSADPGGLPVPDAGLSSGGHPPMMLQLSSGDGSGGFHGQVFPLGLSLEQGKGGFLKPEEASGSGKRFRDDLVDGRASSMKNVRYYLFFFFMLFLFIGSESSVFLSQESLINQTQLNGSIRSLRLTKFRILFLSEIFSATRRIKIFSLYFGVCSLLSSSDNF